MAVVSGIYSSNLQWNKTPCIWQGTNRQSCHQTVWGRAKPVKSTLNLITKLKTHKLLALPHLLKRKNIRKNTKQDIMRSTWYIIIFWSQYMAWLLNILSSCLVWMSTLICSTLWMWLLSPCMLLIAHPLEQHTACRTHHQSGSWHTIPFLSYPSVQWYHCIISLSVLYHCPFSGL